MININKIELSEKDKNILNVLNHLLSSKEISSSEIGQQTSLSPSTISRALARLKKKGMIVSVGKETTDKGRRPDLLCFNKKYGQLVHLDVKPDSVIGYIANMDCEVFDIYQVFFEETMTLNSVLETIGNVYKTLIKRNAAKKQRILAAGISVPGLVNEDARIVQRIPDVFPFNDINVFDYAEKVLKVPVIINNESRLAVIGQHIASYPYSDNLVYLNITSKIGIGAGIMINGNLLKGSQYLAGEIGDMYFDRDNFSQNLGTNIGHLEDYASLKMLFKRVSDKMKDGGAHILARILKEQNIKNLSLKIIETAYDSGDEDVAQILIDILKVWAIAIINICLLINPDYIIIGGIVTSENTTTFNIINELISKDLFFKPQIRLNSMNTDGVLIGGMHILKQYVDNEILAKEALDL